MDRDTREQLFESLQESFRRLHREVPLTWQQSEVLMDYTREQVAALRSRRRFLSETTAVR